jgi:hypothetical protein
MKRIKKVVLSAIMLLGTVAIHAAGEKSEWLSEGSLTERTENWTQAGSLRTTQEDNTPPTEPWGAPIGNGVMCIVAAAGLYMFVKTRKRSIIDINSSCNEY